MSQRTLFAPRGLAAIGASSHPAKLGGAMAASLSSYDGNVALVNSRGGDGLFMAAHELLDGHRGATAVDREELARVLATLGGLLDTYPSICEIETNSRHATAGGLVALDAVVVTETSQRSDHR